MSAGTAVFSRDLHNRPECLCFLLHENSCLSSITKHLPEKKVFSPGGCLMRHGNSFLKLT